jgi:hypothetical protein
MVPINYCLLVAIDILADTRSVIAVFAMVDRWLWKNPLLQCQVLLSFDDD